MLDEGDPFQFFVAVVAASGDAAESHEETRRQHLLLQRLAHLLHVHILQLRHMNHAHIAALLQRVCVTIYLQQPLPPHRVAPELLVVQRSRDVGEGFVKVDSQPPLFAHFRQRDVLKQKASKLASRCADIGREEAEGGGRGGGRRDANRMPPAVCQGVWGRQ